MKILLVAAMPNELRAIREGIKSADLKVNLDIDYLCCGIGNYSTISSLERYFAENKEPTFIWNIGICGYRNLRKEIKFEPIQVSSVINIHTEREMVIPPFLQIAPMRICFSSENVVTKKPKLKKEIGIVDEELYFDMESRGIEFVASNYKYPRLILKIPFDFLGKSPDIKEENYKKMSNEISRRLMGLPYSDYLKKILNRINDNGFLGIL